MNVYIRDISYNKTETIIRKSRKEHAKIMRPAETVTQDFKKVGGVHGLIKHRLNPQLRAVANYWAARTLPVKIAFQAANPFTVTGSVPVKMCTNRRP
jgi:hypothetical protein